MPLPEQNTPWPPPGHGDIQTAYRVWDAWHTGDRDMLASVYGGMGGALLPAGYREFSSQHRGGIVGAVARFFWGEPRANDHQRSPKLHVPVAADIATTSANLLFGQPPTLTVEDTGTQDRLNELFDDDTWAQLLVAAELRSGLGGVYLRVGWDEAVADRPLLSVIGPDAAYPSFAWRTLAEVLFCWTLRVDSNTYLRHLELHLRGRVEHALYLGDGGNLGRQVPLTEHPSTAELPVDAEGGIATGLDDRLDVIYMPNKPNRAWRNDPVGTNLGRPDISGVEPLLDALDEAWTSWMRDVRLAKARAVTGQAWLDNLGPGKGAMFDLDQELFVGLNVPPGTGVKPVELIQAAIRHEAHAATCSALLERVIDGAGYSAQTFGLTGEVAMTATESDARERKTGQTRAAATRVVRPRLAELAETMLIIDKANLGGKATPARPAVEFPPTFRPNPEALARTAQLWDAAGAASVAERVRLIHPDWTGDQVDAEVVLIVGEQPASLADPMAVFDQLDPATEQGTTGGS